MSGMSRDEVIEDILGYIKRNLVVPSSWWSLDHYRERVYLRTAAYDILETIMDNPKMSIDDVLFYWVVEDTRKIRSFPNLPHPLDLIIKDHYLISSMFYEKYCEGER